MKRILKIEYDDTCEYCKKAVEYFKGIFSEQRKNIYASTNIKTGESVKEYLRVIADRNSYGITTHYHLEVVNPIMSSHIYLF